MMKFPREFYIPKGAVKVADKHSDAVAYVHTNERGRPCAMIFFGKQSKPIGNYAYRNEAERTKHLAQTFANRKARADRLAGYREERKNFKHSAQVGDIYHTHWGYDQTNVEFFEIIEIRGKHAILRELQQASEITGWDTGKCVPQSGKYIEGKRGEPIRRLIQDGRIKIDDVRTAWPWGTRVAGTVIGKPERWSSYA